MAKTMSNAQRNALAHAEQILRSVDLPSYVELRRLLDEAERTLQVVKRDTGVTRLGLIEKINDALPNWSDDARNPP